MKKNVSSLEGVELTQKHEINQFYQRNNNTILLGHICIYIYIHTYICIQTINHILHADIKIYLLTDLFFFSNDVFLTKIHENRTQKRNRKRQHKNITWKTIREASATKSMSCNLLRSVYRIGEVSKFNFFDPEQCPGLSCNFKRKTLKTKTKKLRNKNLPRLHPLSERLATLGIIEGLCMYEGLYSNWNK